ncbi:alpha/beta hydrolase [Sphingomonas sp. JC676]|uniref:alpha/beta hydrolase n=1 Tax=Sphingomonas sp. JC676 TaxID=2768065 RepID=UPI001658552A|nr:alpha/beta hydrolase [Sphingomonas sp. JC676]MBC9034103.1 alpha/beta hydrolase [Sphingomonas sp. JC676]
MADDQRNAIPELADPDRSPEAWKSAPAFPLWQGVPPGGSFAKPVDLTADFAPEMLANWPADFLRWVQTPELRIFRPQRANGAAVLVMPGGGYAFLSIRNEGVDIAQRLNRYGYTAFVLTYRLPNEGWHPRWAVPLMDAQRAMRLIRARATEFGVDPARVAALGFSAGGNLAASLATAFAQRLHDPVDAIDAQDSRPAAVGLIYPVITMRAPATHALSRRMLLGAAPAAELIALRSAENHVDATTPPLFLAHALDDAKVPADNSLMMAAACRAAQRPCELHLLQEGGHGFGIGCEGTPASLWADSFRLWLARNGVA